MTKTTFQKKKSILSGTLIVAGIIISSMTSCKAPGPCDAYQGSGKGTRSFKQSKHHRHSEVMHKPASFKA
jgi:hypothetical protein